MSSKQTTNVSSKNVETIKNSPFANAILTRKDDRIYITGFRIAERQIEKGEITINSKK